MQPHDESEFDRLMRDLLDGPLADDDAARLEAILLANRDARDEYRRWMRMEALLECGLAAVQGNPMPGDTRLPAGMNSPSPVHGRVAGGWSRLVPTVLAAMAMGLAALAATQFVARRGAVSGTVATLTAATDARLVDPLTGRGIETAVGSPLSSGPLRLDGGAVQLTFGDGAVVTMNAPAEVELVNASRVFLRRGRLVPLVPPRA